MKKSSTAVLSLIVIGFSLIAMPIYANAEPNSYYGERDSYYGERDSYYGEPNSYYGERDSYYGEPGSHYGKSDKFLDIENAKIGKKDNVIKKIFFETRGEIPEDGSEGAFGYGVVTADNKAIVTTTHAGLLDSEDQMGDIYDPVFHNHFVQLVQQDEDLDFPLCKSKLKIGDLTYESPGEVNIIHNKAILTDLPPSAKGLLSTPPATITPGSNVQIVASFKLQPLIDLVNKDPLLTVCVEDIKPVDNKFVDIFELNGYHDENHYYNEGPEF